MNVEAFWHNYRVMKSSGTQRKGQAMMNALRYTEPELYDMLTGTEYDCFYVDDRVPAFREYVGL